MRTICLLRCRELFRTRLDELMDDLMALGSGGACIETLQFMSYTALAELVHSNRKFMNISQLSKAISMCSSISFNPNLTVGLHSVCTRALLSLIEVLYGFAKNVAAEPAARVKARQLLTRLLETFIVKVKHLRLQVGRERDLVATGIVSVWSIHTTCNCQSAVAVGTYMVAYLCILSCASSTKEDC